MSPPSIAIWTQVQGDPHPAVVILVAVAGALLATWLQRYVIILGTAFGGAWTMMVGGSALMGNATALKAAAAGDVWVAYPMNPAPGQAWVPWVFLALGRRGTLVQMYWTGGDGDASAASGHEEGQGEEGRSSSHSARGGQAADERALHADFPHTSRRTHKSPIAIRQRTDAQGRIGAGISPAVSARDGSARAAARAPGRRTHSTGTPRPRPPHRPSVTRSTRPLACSTQVSARPRWGFERLRAIQPIGLDVDEGGVERRVHAARRRRPARPSTGACARRRSTAVSDGDAATSGIACGRACDDDRVERAQRFAPGEIRVTWRVGSAGISSRALDPRAAAHVQPVRQVSGDGAHRRHARPSARARHPRLSALAVERGELAMPHLRHPRLVPASTSAANARIAHGEVLRAVVERNRRVLGRGRRRRSSTRRVATRPPGARPLSTTVHRVPVPGEGSRGCQAGQAGADDEDIHDRGREIRWRPGSGSLLCHHPAEAPLVAGHLEVSACPRSRRRATCR